MEQPLVDPETIDGSYPAPHPNTEQHKLRATTFIRLRVAHTSWLEPKFSRVIEHHLDLVLDGFVSDVIFFKYPSTSPIGASYFYVFVSVRCVHL